MTSDSPFELWCRMLDPMGLLAAAQSASTDAGNEHPLRELPWFSAVNVAYEAGRAQIDKMIDEAPGLDAAQREKLRFQAMAVAQALSPENFALTNPQALEKAIETKGESLKRGFANLARDLAKGQLTHSDPEAFRLGENIAVTPGKVVHETPLFQIIQYAPQTDEVLETPLVIFPPWINRFYILDLNPQKSFVRWAVEQGISVFMVSWRSADESMADLVWDDYIQAQINAIDFVRGRLGVDSVHTIGYCVAGTTLAATLAVLAAKGQADKVASATFFTAQVDFADGGDLLNFVDDAQIGMIGQLGAKGYVDGRYLAATFNLLRAQDLIWNYVVKHYLLGEDYPAFDLLHWNSDVTNLPTRWHQSYLKDLYRDNLLVQPGALSACGVELDLRLIATPSFIQAGREDHIAPPQSVWKIMDHISGPKTFLLAGSGHIAGVVNPPSANKYQYWTCDKEAHSLEEFIANASETKGSWWPYWLQWLEGQMPGRVAASGRRKPGGRGDKVIEDAPGRYVKMR